MIEDQKWISTSAAAALVGVNPRTLLLWKDTGQHDLVYRRVGKRKWQFYRPSLESCFHYPTPHFQPTIKHTIHESPKYK